MYQHIFLLPPKYEKYERKYYVNNMFFLNNMFKKNQIFITIIFCLICQIAISQNTNSKINIFPFQGLVLNSDSLQPVPFVNIINIRTQRGTITDLEGNFTLKVLAGDTLQISGIGYQAYDFTVLPKPAKQPEVDTIFLHKDTLRIRQVDVMKLRWQQFREEMLNMKEADIKGKPIEMKGFPKREYKPPKMPVPSIANPVSFLYEKFKKEARVKRKIKKMKEEEKKNWFKIERKLPDTINWENE